jgi:hypothetical protein
MHDPIDHPSHYTAGSVECIEALAAMAGIDAHIDHCTQSAVAYLWRWRRKGGPQDLAKARWYIDRAHGLAVQQEALQQPGQATMHTTHHTERNGPTDT